MKRTKTRRFQCNSKFNCNRTFHTLTLKELFMSMKDRVTNTIWADIQNEDCTKLWLSDSNTTTLSQHAWIRNNSFLAGALQLTSETFGISQSKVMEVLSSQESVMILWTERSSWYRWYLTVESHQRASTTRLIYPDLLQPVWRQAEKIMRYNKRALYMFYYCNMSITSPHFIRLET